MNDVFSLHQGSTPLLISVPHDGWHIPTDIVQHMSGAGRAIPDTDWHVAELYEFAKANGASIIAAKMSRYVVDLNRPANDASLYEDQIATGWRVHDVMLGQPSRIIEAEAVMVA